MLFKIWLSLAPLFAMPLDQQIELAARRAFLDPALIRAIIKVESAYNPKAVSSKGAKGLMQLMPKTADEYGVHTPFHTLSNLMGASLYLRTLINRYHDLKLALAAYHSGPGRVDKMKRVPQVSVEYVEKILSLLKKETP